jgi:prepilin-type N-terminal cleavage/methylation domain-containing protein
MTYLQDRQASTWKERHGFSPDRFSTRAFTLVETIVVIAIIGLLVALVLPTLGPIKRKATLAGIASDLKNHVAIFTMYTMDYKGVYPYFTDPDATYTVVRHSDITLELLYYDAHSFWNFALADGYYDGQLASPSMFPADMNVRHGYGTSYVMTYYYSCNFIASPAFWNKKTRTGPEQWRPVRNAQVVYPSKKGLLIDESGAAWGLDDGVIVPARGPPFGNTVGFIDGSARFIAEDRLIKGYLQGDGNWWGCFHHTPDPVLHTIDGVRGRDVQ